MFLSSSGDIINEKFEDAKRRAFSYYVYLIPFVNIENFRKEIIKKIAKDRNVNKNEIYMKFI